MTRIAQVLARKGAHVVTISPHSSVAELVNLLADHNVGAVVVVEGTAMVGIVSERDVVRHAHEHDAQVLALPVSQLMTREVISCGLEDDVADVTRTMTHRRVRHVPVVKNGSVVGIVSIGDMIMTRIAQLENEQAHLHSALTIKS